MSAKVITCDICGGNSLEQFFKSEEWSNSGRYTLTPTVIEKKTEISLVFCIACGHIRQAPGQEVKCDYLDISRDTSRQAPNYVNEIINSLSNFKVKKNDLILEVGANDGSFLNFLRDCGYNNLLGIEPSIALSKTASSQGHRIIQDYFSPELARLLRVDYGEVAAIICRHTLEHVPNPKEIMDGMTKIIRPNGIIFIEVPDSDWIISNLAAYEIWDEHIGYFRAGSLKKLLENSGLKPIKLKKTRFRDTQNLLSWSILENHNITEINEIAIDCTLIEELFLFQKRWDAFSKRLLDALSSAPHPIAVVGASHIQLNYLNFNKLSQFVDFLIDDDPEKSGHYVYLGKSLPIVTTNYVIANMRTGSIILSGFPYPQWHENITKNLADTEVTIIDPELLK